MICLRSTSCSFTHPQREPGSAEPAPALPSHAEAAVEGAPSPARAHPAATHAWCSAAGVLCPLTAD